MDNRFWQISLLLVFVFLMRPVLYSQELNQHKHASQSKLKTGTWIKFTIQNDGLYKISYDELRSKGISNPERARIFGYGSGMLPLNNDSLNFDDLVECSVKHSANSILFFARGPLQWAYDTIKHMYLHKEHSYANYSSYFISSDYTGGEKKINSSYVSSGTSVEETISSYIGFKVHETRDTNLVISGRSWYGKEYFDGVTDYNFNFNFQSLLTDTFSVYFSGVARSNYTSQFTVKNESEIQNIEIGGFAFSDDGLVANEGKKKLSFYNSSQKDNINISVSYSKPASNSVAWLDYIVVNAYQDLVFSGEQFEFRYYHAGASEKNVSFRIKSSSGEIEVWDISDFHNAEDISLKKEGDSYFFTYTLKPGDNKFIAFHASSGSFKVSYPDNYIVENQNIHGQPIPEMVIIVDPLFMSYAHELADFHSENDNISSLVVTQESVFNEFSSGTPDPSAIRNMMRMFYEREKKSNTNTLRYLLLFGDGSYDNISTNKDNTNFVITFQSEKSLHPTDSYVTDDFFGILDWNESGARGKIQNATLDVGIGRLPVKTEQEAMDVLNKIYNYSSTNAMGNWRNQLTFVADDADDNQPQHLNDADGLTQYITTNYPAFNIEKIYLDAYPQITSSSGERYPEVNKAIQNRIKTGTLIFNYTGHGHETGLAHEKILNIPEIKAFDNQNKLPVFMTATCEFSRFDDYKQVTAGEELLLNPYGGAIALFTTTRLVFIFQNKLLNTSFYQNVFTRDENGNKLRLGDVMRKTKNGTKSDANKLNFTLLGDPALEMAYPTNNVVTDSISGSPITENSDTLKAYKLVKLSGHIQDKNGESINDFNGVVYPTIYDKKTTVKTLGNDEYDPLTYELQNNIIYKGRVEVINGYFSFSFVIPGDISYNVDFGRISYYAENESIDASGYVPVLIGGSNSSSVVDNEGPEIQIFMNNSNFKSGGITNESPTIYALISDESGINTTGTAIGHDIALVLDGNVRDKQIINDFFIADLNSYTSGIVQYQLSDLEPGLHSIELKVWDIYDNSSAVEMDFEVLSSKELIIENLENFPNPFSQSTNIYFTHNQAANVIDYTVMIYSLDGREVKRFTQENQLDGYRMGPYIWDGTNNNGDFLNGGMYICRVYIKTLSGMETQKTNKIIYIK